MAVFSGNGSAASPSFTFSSDTNLGIFRGGTDILSFSTGGTERAHIDDVGNFELGGTPGTSPATTLFAAGGAEFSDLVHVVNDVAFADGATSLAESYSLAGFRVTPSSNSSNCINVGPRSNTSDMYIQGSNNPGTASRDFYLQPFGGNINIGVTEILLNGDGSAYFGDQVDIGGTDASPNISLNENGSGVYSSFLRCDLFRSQDADNVNTTLLGAFATTNGGAAVEKCIIRGDGVYIGSGITNPDAATPGDANIILRANGEVLTNDKFAIQGTGGQAWLLCATDDLTFRTLNQGGGNSQRLKIDGGVNLTQIEIMDGDATSPTPVITFDGNGAAYFGDQVDIGGTSASPNISLAESGNGVFGTSATQRAQLNATAGLFLGQNGTTSVFRIDVDGNVDIGGTISGTSSGAIGNNPNIKLQANGECVFTGRSSVGDNQETLLGETGFVQTHRGNPGAGTGQFTGGANGTIRFQCTPEGRLTLDDSDATSGSSNVVLDGDNGNATFAGALSKGSGSFKIDHPLPALNETHHLVHSFIEGPQADNIYRGQVDLVDGTATVNLDTAARMTEGTFVLLNTNISCFTSNETDWTAVRGSVSGNVLTIEAQDNTSTATVSWMVVGERQDKHMIDTAWTDENGRVITEPEKSAE